MTLILMRVLPEGDMTRTAVAVQNPGEDTIRMLLLRENKKTPTLMHLRRENVSKMSQTATHRRQEGQEEVQTLTYLRPEEEAMVDQILTYLHPEWERVWGRA